MARPLTVKSLEEAKAAGWDVTIVDKDENPLGWELVQKASFEDHTERVLHTTKRRRVPGGWGYESYTEILVKGEKVLNEDGKTTGFVRHPSPAIACSKAGWFVPEPTVNLVRDALLVTLLEEALEKWSEDHEENEACAMVRKVADALSAG